MTYIVWFPIKEKVSTHPSPENSWCIQQNLVLSFCNKFPSLFKQIEYIPMSTSQIKWNAGLFHKKVLTISWLNKSIYFLLLL